MDWTIAGVELDRRKCLVLGVAILACIGFAWVYRSIDVEAVNAWAGDMNGLLVFGLMTLLPLVGFPVTVTHAVAGMRFGMARGLALAALSIVLQMLLSYALVKAAPKMFARRLEGLRRRLPAGAHLPVTLFTILLPGVPYFAKNYVLPLIGVPLRTYLLCGATIHIARSLVGVAFGHMSEELTPARIAAFAAYFLVVMATCAWALRRVQAQVKTQQPAEGGRTQPA